MHISSVRKNAQNGLFLNSSINIVFRIVHLDLKGAPLKSSYLENVSIYKYLISLIYLLYLFMY